MDYSYIDKLLERYWQGETSVEEEEMLRTFFRQRELPSRFEPYRRLFAYEDVAASEHLGAEFDERMLRMIEPGEQHVVRARHISVAARLRPFLKAAASVAVVLTIGGAIEHISAVHRYIREEDVPAHTLFVITTDGLENSSRRFSSR